MSEQQGQTGERVYERCLCREAIDCVKRMVTPSEPVRQHLVNSRIEFLKAVRTAIDERINHLSSTGAQGTKVAVE